MIDLTEAELGEAAAVAIDESKCRSLMLRERQARGITEYREQASCILGAERYDQLGECR